MEWAGKEKHMGGIPRKIVVLAVGAFAKAAATLLNTTSVHNADTLIHLVRSRPPGIPLLTISNHMSTSVHLKSFFFLSFFFTWFFIIYNWIIRDYFVGVSNHIMMLCSLDDPLIWGFKGFPSLDAKLARWVLAAEDICFKNSLLTYFFRLGMPFLFPTSTASLPLFFFSISLRKTIKICHIISLWVWFYC